MPNSKIFINKTCKVVHFVRLKKKRKESFSAFSVQSIENRARWSNFFYGFQNNQPEAIVGAKKIFFVWSKNFSGIDIEILKVVHFVLFFRKKERVFFGLFGPVNWKPCTMIKLFLRLSKQLNRGYCWDKKKISYEVKIFQKLTLKFWKWSISFVWQ